MKLPANLEEARKRLKREPVDIASACRVSVTSVLNWERGRSIKSDYILDAVAAYGLSTADEFLEVHRNSKPLGKPLMMAMTR